MKQKTLKTLIILLALILAAVLILTVVLTRQEKTPQETGPSTQGQTDGKASASAPADTGDMLPLDTEGADVSDSAAETTPAPIDPTSATDVPIEGLPDSTDEAPGTDGNTDAVAGGNTEEASSQAPTEAPSEEPTEKATEGTLPPNMLPIG